MIHACFSRGVEKESDRLDGNAEDGTFLGEDSE